MLDCSTRNITTRDFLEFARLIAVAMVILALPTSVWANCTCGYGDGQYTLTSIRLDGNTSDWAAVWADTDNNVCDGPANNLLDRDAPVGGSGKDLVHFAYTWDQSSIYLFTERSNASSNTLSFVYYADVNNDGFMQTGEPVVAAAWKGGNRTVDIYLMTYIAIAPGGDPMVDGNQFSDGLTLPGSFANQPKKPNRSGKWGNSNGQQMEFAISFAELGIPNGSPVTFHVSSSNSSIGSGSFAAQIDDNLSGCGGGLGSTRTPGVIFAPDLSATSLTGQTVVLAHTLTNTGDTADTFNLSTVFGGGFALTANYYVDVDNSGGISAGDALLSDSTGDSIPDSGIVLPTQSMTILIAYDIPLGAAPGSPGTAVTTASSNYQPQVNVSVVDTITAMPSPNLVMLKSVRPINDPVNATINPKAIPGAEMLYTIRLTNQGPGAVDQNAIAITDPIPTGACLDVGDSGAAGSGPVVFQDGSPTSALSYQFSDLAATDDDIAFSRDGGQNYDYSPTPGPGNCDPLVTHIRITPKGSLPGAITSAPNASFSFRIIVK